MNQKIRIKLKSFDHNLVDKSAEKIVKTVKSTGAVISGPVPLPTRKQIFTVNRSTFVNKKAREQFQLCTFKRILDIYSSTPKTIDALMKLELPSGVEVEIKVQSWNCSRAFLLTKVERFTVKICLRVGRGTGPLTTAPVLFTVFTIFSADLSTRL